MHTFWVLCAISQTTLCNHHCLKKLVYISISVLKSVTIMLLCILCKGLPPRFIKGIYILVQANVRSYDLSITLPFVLIYALTILALASSSNDYNGHMYSQHSVYCHMTCAFLVCNKEPENTTPGDEASISCVYNILPFSLSCTFTDTECRQPWKS